MKINRITVDDATSSPNEFYLARCPAENGGAVDTQLALKRIYIKCLEEADAGNRTIAFSSPIDENRVQDAWPLAQAAAEALHEFVRNREDSNIKTVSLLATR